MNAWQALTRKETMFFATMLKYSGCGGFREILNKFEDCR